MRERPIKEPALTETARPVGSASWLAGLEALTGPTPAPGTSGPKPRAERIEAGTRNSMSPGD